MLLDRRQFFIREHVSVMKLMDTYDILDPALQLPGPRILLLAVGLAIDIVYKEQS